MVKLKNRYLIAIKVVFLLFIIIIPWSISDYGDNVRPEKITSDLRFYERNTCSISINEFLISNPNVIYQDHYKIRFNNYSSIKCFGQITGVDQINHVFYISVGSNVLVGLFLQTSFWLLLISFIKKDENKLSLKIKDFVPIFVIPLFLIFGLYSEIRFYSKNLYLIDLTKFDHYLNLYTYFLFVTFFSYLIFQNRKENLIYSVPYLFLFMMLFNGFNLYLPVIFFATYGLKEILSGKLSKIFLTILSLYSLFWLYQAAGNNYYLKPDKVRGLSSTIYTFSATFYWTVITFTLVVGIFYYFSSKKEKFDYSLLIKPFLLSGIAVLIVGYLSSGNPLIRFMTYYYSGLTKYPTDNQNLFLLNEWGEKVAWRGMFPSAESIGEFYGLILLLLILKMFSHKQISYLEAIFSLFCILGLYASNNKTAFLLLAFCILYKYTQQLKPNRVIKITLSGLFLFLLIFFIRLDNLLLDFNFTSNNMVGLGYASGYENFRSSSINYLSNLSSNNVISLLIMIVGQVGFLINRSELWGLFLARYNPSFSEFMLGTGPYNLAKHYGEVDIVNTRSFLLPHSSFLNLILFFGFIFFMFFIVFVFRKLIKLKKINFDLYLINIYIFINLIKSDSILYISTLTTYLAIFTICLAIIQKKYSKVI